MSIFTYARPSINTINTPAPQTFSSRFSLRNIPLPNVAFRNIKVQYKNNSPSITDISSARLLVTVDKLQIIYTTCEIRESIKSFGIVSLNFFLSNINCVIDKTKTTFKVIKILFMLKLARRYEIA
jgi:hypothetical protein